jgi:hypothetical protein
MTGALPFVVDFSPEHLGHFWERRIALVAHLAGGTVALLAGPFQLWSGGAGIRIGPHRWVGRAYVVAVLMGGSAAFYLSAYTQEFAKQISLQALGVVWWTTTWKAYRAIRTGRESQHRTWAMRSYAVTFSFVIFRLGAEAGVLRLLGSEPVAVWICLSWVIPLLITEFTARFRLRLAHP